MGISAAAPGKEITMLNKTRRMIFLPAAAALLSACGGTPARSPELLSANNSPTAM
jgi:hypothetical protein